MSEIVFNSPPPNPSSLNSQVENFQTTLASLNQQVIFLQETLQEREQEIKGLKENQYVDNTLTIVGALIRLYRLLFTPGKVT